MHLCLQNTLILTTNVRFNYVLMEDVKSYRYQEERTLLSIMRLLSNEHFHHKSDKKPSSSSCRFSLHNGSHPLAFSQDSPLTSPHSDSLCRL